MDFNNFGKIKNFNVYLILVLYALGVSKGGKLMQRKNKNIILSIVIVALVGCISLTMYFANKNTTSKVDNNFNNMNSIGGPGGSQDNSSTNTPPAKPDDDNSSQRNGGMPPQKPGNDDKSDSSNQGNVNGSDNNQNMTPPNDNAMNGSDSNQSAPKDMPGSGMTSNSNNKKSLSASYIILLGVESLALGACLIYLIMSKANKKIFKETFGSSDKIIIYVLGLGLLTVVEVGSEIIIVNRMSMNSSNTNFEMIDNNAGSDNVSYKANTEITNDATVSKEEYTSSEAGTNSLMISDGANVVLDDIEVSKTGDDNSGDATSFYGTNSGILIKDGANVTITNADIKTSAVGANGVFSFGGSATTNNTSGDGTTVTISDSTITTEKDNSGGIMTTGGGIMYANNLTINTAGTSSAAIRSDRGGGTVVVDGGNYKTTGQGSPTVYSTADITVKNANLTATASEGIVIEGKNKVVLDSVVLTDTNNKLNGQSTTYKNIFLYQSMSGDAADGESYFSSKDSNITTNKGDTIYVTNTTAEIVLENNNIINNDATGCFLRIQKDSWGNSGSNGGNVKLSMINQKVNGNIAVDSISTLDMSLTDSSSFIGAINNDNEAKSIKLVLDKTSKIKLTGDSYITSLDNADASNSNIDFNGYTLYVDGVAVNK